MAEAHTRRKLWQLSAPAHELLAALALPPQQLQRCAEQALSRVHRARCVLQGSPADVLYSVVHDLAQRNAVSEAVHRALEQQHAAAVRRAAPLRQPEALWAVWLAAKDSPGFMSAVWALLTHPLGEPLEQALLHDARCQAFSQARLGLHSTAQAAAVAERLQALQADNEALHLRLQAKEAEHAQQQRAAAEELARLRGALRAAQAPPKPACPVERAPQIAMPRLRAALAEPAPIAAAAPPAAQPATLRGQRVLCVGGMPGAQMRYRHLVEAAGACFAFHDGGIEHSVQRLDQQLGAADVVVCQAGCLNHEAYRRVKGHCRRLAKPCLFVERPSLAHFARTLGVVAA